MATPIKQVVIVGGGTAGWMSAASLIKYAQGKNLNITLIESTDIGTVGVGEATIPSIVQFNHQIGLDELNFIKATQATFKLGIQFEQWTTHKDAFFHPFSDYGLAVNNIPFHHYLNKLRHANIETELSDYSFSTVLAQENRFAQPHANPNTPLADYSYAYHFDAGLYANLLKQHATSQGVHHIDAKIEQVNCSTVTGFIESVTLTDGSQIKADLFVDCTGFKGILIEETLNTGYEDWSEWLLCDKAIAVQSQLVDSPAPYTRAIAHANGWQWRIPLQHRMGNGYIYASQFEQDDVAMDNMLTNITGDPSNQPKHFQFKPGRRKQIWNKNCFAIGLSSGFLEPIESTSISLIQSAITKLLEFFPDSDFNQHDISEVNRLHNAELEHIRDFIILHYKLSNRQDSEFWRYCQSMAIPETLAHKIALFESRGHIVLHEKESFEAASWLTMYNGFGVQPKRYDPRADAIDNEVLLQNLKQMQRSIRQAASQASSHQDFIFAHCKADN
ncbi:tryptophan halogenase family protein [Shewanella waksmanii]|uniref:tryptophan halogenase family protein n=1 Tax=Shewanella waksmanii TaxID=213783 RepID=UPI0037369A57